METHQLDALTITTDLVATFNTLKVVWRGRSDSREPHRLIRPILQDVLRLAATRSLTVSMHFEELQYFNSSTISELVQFVNDARMQRVALRLHYDGKLKWQKLSFEALSRAMKVFEESAKVELVARV